MEKSSVCRWSFLTWCCAGDEVSALRSRPAVGGFKPPHAALAEDRRGKRCGKGAREASGGDRKDGAQSSFSGVVVDVSLLNQVASKPGCSRSARDESGGCPCFWPGGVRHVGDVSPVCGSCTERVCCMNW